MMSIHIFTGKCRFIPVFLFCWFGLAAQNDALYFDGNNDYIVLSPIQNLPAMSDFTVEMWFTSEATGGNVSCNGSFRRLFALSAPGNFRFEVGECQGILSTFLVGAGIRQSSINVRDNHWHCISAVRQGSVINIYLDGNLVPGLSSIPASGFTATTFIVGRWTVSSAPDDEDWVGKIDDIRLWNIALSQTNLTACNACVQHCDEPGLIAYWSLDDGKANENNSSITQVWDCTANANHGKLSSPNLSPAGFTLTDPTGLSNFTISGAPLLYPTYNQNSVFISDPLQDVGIMSICRGEPVHFSIQNLSDLAQSGAGVSVQWYYSDDHFNSETMIAPGQGALYNGFSFVSPPDHVATTPPVPLFSPNAFVDRCYRAKINVSDGQKVCTYITEPACLRICLPVQNAALNIIPSPLAPAVTFCQDDNISKFTVSLNSNMPQPNGFNEVHIKWSVIDGGMHILLSGPGYDDQTNITYGPTTLSLSQICFIATISNCSCPSVTVQKCFQVDPKPKCGAITGSLNPGTLDPDPDGNPDHYIICPHNDAAMEMVGGPSTFKNCNPVWQYMYPNTQPGIWHDMGGSNANQNTGILPHSQPMIAPYMWPAGETCIFYRIECKPLTTNSGCPPCHTNELRVCLKTPPPPPQITVSPNPVCKGSSTQLNVENPDPNCIYDWYFNGWHVWTGSAFNSGNTGNSGCYRATCNDGCFVVQSDKTCLKTCEVVGIISCPIPVCPCRGDEITLDASKNSYSTCGNPLSYQWFWEVDGVTQSATGPILTNIPSVIGTLYTVIITDMVLGCTDSVQYLVVPCSPN